MATRVTLTTSGGTSNLVGTVTLTAVPAGGSVKSVQFYVDDVLKSTDTSSPYTYAWDTTVVAVGAHQLKVRALFAKNQVAEKKLDVTVANQQTPPPPPPTIEAVPVNVVPLVISGTTTQGQLLTVTNGTWTNSPTSYARNWTRCDAAGANCAVIPSAIGNTYTLTADDVGKTIRCWITAYNSVGASAPLLSVQTAVVSALAPAVPVLVTTPVISGTPVQGDVLSISNGDWVGSPTSYSRQWIRCDTAGEACVDRTGAIGSTYLLESYDVGLSMRCWTTATNASGDSIPARSAATALVSALPPPSPPPPGPTVFTTNVVAGQEITAPFAWTASVTPAPTSVEFYADGTLLATDSSSPYSHSLTLAPGSHTLGLCALHSGVRSCYPGGYNITVAGTPTPPPPPPPAGNPLLTKRVTLQPGSGMCAYWLKHDSPNTQIHGPAGDRYTRIIRWAASPANSDPGLYSARLTYCIFGFRLLPGGGFPGRMYDFHQEPYDDPRGWSPLAYPGGPVAGTAPLAIDYTGDSRGLCIQYQPEDWPGSGIFKMPIYTTTQMEALRGQWVWLWLEVRWGASWTIGFDGGLRCWVHNESTPRVNVQNINTHWVDEHDVSFWEGEYILSPTSTSTVEIAATRFGTTPQKAYEDVPILASQGPAGTGVGSSSELTPRLSTEAAIPLSLRW